MLRFTLPFAFILGVACTETSDRSFTTSALGIDGGEEPRGGEDAGNPDPTDREGEDGGRTRPDSGDDHTGSLTVPLVPPGPGNGELPGGRCVSEGQCDDGNACNGIETCEDGRCLPGELSDNGEWCDADADESRVCRDGNCLLSRCGDGVVDERADEVCDDGNSENGDGCDDCRFSCETAANCDDSNICNGDEACDAELHTCVVGEPADEETACGDSYVCRGGQCVSTRCGDSEVDSDEECDDGNLDGGDGCDANCTYECEKDDDCNDGNVCNGQETCNSETHACVAGTTLDCGDGNACTDDLCDSLAGCFAVLVDADGDGQAPSTIEGCGTDCDDDEPSVFAGAGELCDGIDNNCDGRTDEVAPFWYPDCDGDGFATIDAVGVQQCETPESAPSGCARGLAATWTSRPPEKGADCWDSDPSVYPRADAVWSTDPIPGRKDLPFDYNCSDQEEVRWTTVGVSVSATCSSGIIVAPVTDLLSLVVPDLVVRPVLCSGAAGWVGRAAPTCGNPAAYTYCDGCTRVTEDREQQCQ